MMLASQSSAVLIFTYGSNMSSKRLVERVPSARAVGVGILKGYKLRWHKISTDGSGKCDAALTGALDAEIYGVLYKIALAEKSKLDKAEGLGKGYEERNVVIDCKGVPVTAQMYYATKIDPSLKPWSWYKEYVVAGAREHGLPPAYVAMIETTEAVQDPDTERHDKEMALISNM
jgi:AIG2-like family